MKLDWRTRLEEVEARQRDLALGVSGLDTVIGRLREEWECERMDEAGRSRIDETRDELLGDGVPEAAGPPALPVRDPEPTSTTVPESAWGPEAAGAQDQEANRRPERESAARTEPRESFELKLGRVWFVRIGVVLLLTGFVFLANYAYREWVMDWGAFPRALMLFAASGVMSFIGFGIERKRPAMARFGQVLGAGGLAGVFYTLYASHYVEPLRWITSGFLTGGLLLGWTGVMVWIADRRKSEFLAGFSLLLAYYTCVVTPISGFLLFANLLLTVASVFFLLRNRWRTISLCALPVTYGAFVFWQYLVAGAPGSPEGGLTALGYLGCYWSVFTVAAFLSRRGEMGEGVKPAWVALNNVALFALGAYAIPALNGDWFWVWCLVLGGLFLGLAYLAARTLPDVVAVSRVYLAEGLLLVTLGFLAKFTGQSLMLILVVESVAMLIASRFHWRRWYRAAAYLAALLGVIVGLDALWAAGLPVALAAGGAVLILCGEGFWVRSREGGGTFGGYYFALLAQALLGMVAYRFLPIEWCVLAMTAFPVVAIATVAWHRYRELGVGSLALLVAGHLCFAMEWIEAGTLPLWSIGVLLVLTIAAGQIWQRQKVIDCRTDRSECLQFYLAAVEVVLPALMLYGNVEDSAWIPYGVLIATGFYFKGAFLGSGWSTLLGQGYLLLAAVASVIDMGVGSPHWLMTLLPIAGLAGAARHARVELQPWLPFWDSPGVRLLRPLAVGLYPVASLGLLALWTLTFTDDATRAVAFAGIASTALGYGLWRKNRFALRCWLAFALASLVAVIWIGVKGNGFGIWDGMAVLMVVAGQHFVWREEELLNAVASSVVAALGLSLGWWMVHRTVADAGSGLYLTIGWCVYGAAVLGAGFANRQRLYRMAGLALLAATGARLFFVDLWAYGTLTRILSFLALGLVLVVVGFVYNRYSDAIRKFL